VRRATSGRKSRHARCSPAAGVGHLGFYLIETESHWELAHAGLVFFS
jgi:hypothetical protein